MRSYQLWVAHEGASETEFLEEVGDLMFSEGKWRLLMRPSEGDSLRAYRLAARLGCAGYEHTRVRHRWWPYKTFYMLKDSAIADELEDTADCLLDEYTSDFKKYYAGRMTRSMAKAELMAIVVNLETDTGSTERLHDVNERRRRMRVHTHDQELCELSAWFSARCCAESKIATGGYCGAAQSRRVRHRPEPKPTDAGPPNRRSKLKEGAWSWRACLHVEAKGRWMSPEVVAELSEKYRGLSQDEMEYYRELGAIAADRVRHGEKAFGKRNRQHQPAGQAGTRFAARCDEGQPPEAPVDVPDAEHASLVEASPPRDRLPYPSECRVTMEAKCVEQGARSGDAAEKAEDQRVIADICSHSEKVVDEAVKVWSLIGKGPESLHAGDHNRLSVVAEPSSMLVLAWQKPPGSVTAASAKHLSQTGLDANVERWEKLHREIRLEDCPKLGKVAAKPRPCHVAQKCLCNRPGTSLATTADQFKMGIAKAKRMHSDFRTLLRSGYVVMHLSWAPQPVPPAIMSGSEDEPSPVAPLPAGVCWLHIGLFYERPIRPTFVAMERDSAFDEDGLLGLQACRHPSHQRELHCMTECEAFGDLLDPEAEEIICKFYCLVARPNRR